MVEAADDTRRSPSLAVKIATLLFSGGIASTAVIHGILTGCEAAPTPASFDPEPEPITFTPRPAPAPPKAPPPRYFGGSKSDADVWGGLQNDVADTEDGAEPQPRVFGGAKFEPDVGNNANRVGLHGDLHVRGDPAAGTDRPAKSSRARSKHRVRSEP